MHNSQILLKLSVHLAQAAGYGSIKPGISSIKSTQVLQGRRGVAQGLLPNGILITAL